MIKFAGITWLVIICLVFTNCGGGTQSTSSNSNSNSNPTPEPVVTPLSYADMFSSQAASSPVDDSLFAPPSNASAPGQSFEGRLVLVNVDQSGGYSEIRNDYASADPSGYRKHLPGFSFDFVQDGSDLIPAREGLVYTEHPFWNYIIGPGRVWQQSDDSGYMRASFPFALVNRYMNCVHNGEMSFLFSNTKSPNVSNVRYQITQETCLEVKFNMWGKVAATYTPGTVSDAATLKSDHAAELANRMPSKPLSALATDYPGVNPAAFIRDYTAPEHITTYGLVVNGINYVAGCQTRYGSYPFCDQMRLPSFSAAKSAFAGVALMRLGQLYGTGVYSELIRNHVPEYVYGGDWTNVTFDHASDMATGNYISSAYWSDEGSLEVAFGTTQDYASKIRLAFSSFPHSADPGTTWVYHSQDAFILTQAMNDYLQTRQGASADIFNLVRDDVYRPLKLSKGGLTTQRTDNSDSGKPIGAWGLLLNQDDVAKIGKFLDTDNGANGGEQLLEPSRLRESLFRDSAVLGLPVPNNALPNPPRYNNNFWAWKMTAAQYGCDFWVPYMSGHGGIKIALMPNGTTFYVFSDNNEFPWDSAPTEANKIAPFCKP